MISETASMVQDKNLNARVESFLESRESTWRDMNVSMRDGRILYDIILKNDYKQALEIGLEQLRSPTN